MSRCAKLRHVSLTLHSIAAKAYPEFKITAADVLEKRPVALNLGVEYVPLDFDDSHPYAGLFLNGHEYDFIWVANFMPYVLDVPQFFSCCFKYDLYVFLTRVRLT